MDLFHNSSLGQCHKSFCPGSNVILSNTSPSFMPLLLFASLFLCATPLLCLTPAAIVLTPTPLWNSASQPANQCHNALGPNTIRRASQAHLTHRPLSLMHTHSSTRTVQHFFTPSATVTDRDAVYTRGLRDVLFTVAVSLQRHFSNQNKNTRTMVFILNTHTFSLVVTHDISLHMFRHSVVFKGIVLVSSSQKYLHIKAFTHAYTGVSTIPSIYSFCALNSVQSHSFHAQ